MEVFFTNTNGTSVSYIYDSFSRITQKTEYTDHDFNYFYTYDTKGNLDEYTFPSGYVIKNAYNSNGSLRSVTDKTASKTIYMPGNFNARGQMKDYTNSDNTLYTTLQYDPYGLPTFIQTGLTAGGTTLQNLETNFNVQTGNLNYRKDKNIQINGTDLIETFTYDQVHKNRLATWQVTGQPQYSMTYADNNGNVLTKSDFTSTGNPYNYIDPNDPDHPHAIKSVTAPLQFPAEASQHIIYNIFNKVSEITHTNQGLRYTIDYGPDEQRVKSQYFINNNVLQETKYYVGGDYEEEVNGSGVVTRRLHYLPGGGLYVINQAGAGTMYYVLTDYQGSWCRVITDAGVTVERYSFDPWGRRRHADNWNVYYVPTSFTFDRGYTGHEMLDAFGLINMNGRVYDPIIARFLSPDNYVQSPTSSQGFNRYSYCLNNPLVYTDPSGEFIFTVLAAIFAPPLLPLAIAADISGMMNLAMNANNIDNFGQGLAYYGIGAAAGAIGAGVGMGVNAAIAGASFWAGVAGTSTVVSTGFASGFVSGAAGGFAGGFASGFGNAAMEPGNGLGDMFKTGWDYGWKGAIIGGVGGGIIGGIDAVSHDRNFLTGAGKQDVVVKVNTQGTGELLSGKDYDAPYSTQSTRDYYWTRLDNNASVTTNADGQVRIKIPNEVNRINGISTPDNCPLLNCKIGRKYITFTPLDRTNVVRLQGWRYYSNPLKSFRDLFYFRTIY